MDAQIPTRRQKRMIEALRSEAARFRVEPHRVTDARAIATARHLAARARDAGVPVLIVQELNAYVGQYDYQSSLTTEPKAPWFAEDTCHA